MKIPYLPLKELNARFIDQDQQVLNLVQESGQYIGGDYVAQFESEFASFCNVDHVIGTGNGLDAITLILKAEQQLGNLPQNAKILLPAHTYIATYLSIVHAGMQPVPVDVTDLLLSVENLESQIDKVDAILTVDLYGRLVDDAVYAFAKAKQKPIYCDSAQSHGAINAMGNPSGSIARASAFSFYPTKNLGALGDGGAVTTADNDLAAMVRKLANYGRESRFVNDVKGVNSRLDPLQAGFLLNRLPSLQGDNAHRLAVGNQYVKQIDNPQIQLPRPSFLQHNAMHVFPVFVDDRERFIDYLDTHGIGANVHYPIPPHRQEAFNELNDLSFPRTEYLHNTEVSLPCHPLLNEQQLEHIIKVINKY